MKSKIVISLLLFVTLLLVFHFVYATPLKKGYPDMCVDHPTSPTQEGSEWRPCSLSSGKKGPTAVAGSDVQVFASRLIGKDINWCLYLKNAGGGGGSAMSDWDIQVSPNGTDWSSLTFTTCDTDAAGVMCTYCVNGNAFRYIKVEADATDTTVEVWYTSNRG